MANPSSAEDAGPSPQTCCATCGTVFEVSPELLGSSDTRVRCGECYRIFDALANLMPRGGASDAVEAAARDAVRVRTDSAELTVFPGRGRAANGSRDTEDGVALDVTYSDFDLFSEDADLPDVAYFDRTSETPEFDFDSVELEHDETFDDTLFAHDVTIDAETVADAPPTDPLVASVGPDAPGAPEPGAPEPEVTRLEVAQLEVAQLEVIEPEVPREPLNFVYRDPDPDPEPEVGPGPEPKPGPADVPLPSPVLPFDLEPAPPTPRRRRWPVVLMGFALAGLIVGLHAWRVRDAPANDPFVRPAYVALCWVAGCEVPARVALDRLTLLRRERYPQSEIDDALVIDVAFRNDAPFPQRPPVLVVLLSNSIGQRVVRRAFAPADYLPAGEAGPGATIPAGGRRDTRLEVSDPGEDTFSFEIEFAES